VDLYVARLSRTQSPLRDHAKWGLPHVATGGLGGPYVVGRARGAPDHRFDSRDVYVRWCQRIDCNCRRSERDGVAFRPHYAGNLLTRYPAQRVIGGVHRQEGRLLRAEPIDLALVLKGSDSVQ